MLCDYFKELNGKYVNNTSFRVYLVIILKVFIMPISSSIAYFKVSTQKTMQSERGLSALWTSVNHIALGGHHVLWILELGDEPRDSN